MEEVKAVFKYERDTKRFHRFNVITTDGDVELNGTIYIGKGHGGLPKRIVMEYQGKYEGEQENAA
jgi:hypothetical protein